MSNVGKLSRIAIVNRGEPAMRLIRAVRDWNAAGKPHLETVALYTDPDRGAPFVREADHTYALGPAMFDDPSDLDEAGRPRVKSRYLDYRALRAALTTTGADAAWVGWGFVAEHAAFADLCTELGVTFIGPPAEAMRALGDKIASKLLAEKAKVPVAAWSGGPVASLADAQKVAEEIGFPLMVKATAGGGGRGIRLVASAGELGPAFESAANEARKAFGDPTLFLEACVNGARHVEVQVLADRAGTVWAVGVRDCTAQRSRQKVIEEAPSPVLTPGADQALRDAAVSLARVAGYVNAGTVEFLYDPALDRTYFMEMNTRLQVEHPVTEATTGLDLVGLQLAIAAGESLPPSPPPTVGHSVEVRLCAEDPDRNFAPQPGRIARFRAPLGPGVRTDAGIREGDEIPVEFDSMVAKIIAHGATREQAIARLRRALDETQLVIEGGTTNRAFLSRLLEHPDFVSGNFDTRWIDRLMAAGSLARGRDAHVALLATAIRRHEEQLAEQTLNFFAAAARGRPAMGPAERRAIELRLDGVAYEFEVSKLGPGSYRVGVDGATLDVSFATEDGFEARLGLDSEHGQIRHRVVSVTSGADHLVEVDGYTYRISGDPGGVVRAPAPGLVLSIQVAEGDRVEIGTRLLSLEAMKMEMPMTAPVAGRVRKIFVGKSMQVGAGAPLLVLEPEGTAAAAASTTARVAFPKVDFAGDAFAHGVEDLRRVLLGFDVGAMSPAELLSRFVKAGTPEARAAATDDLLGIYLAIEETFSRSAWATPDGFRMSHEECLHLYLRELPAEGKGLPQDFRDSLSTALTRYGVTSLTDTPRLRDALAWMYRAHQNLDRRNQVVVGLLDRCVDDPQWRDLSATPSFARLLQNVVRLARDLHPRVYEAAEQARYVLFTGRGLEERMHAAYARVEKLLASASADPAGRPAMLAELAQIPYALTNRFAPNLLEDDPVKRALLLELLMRHFYRGRRLEDVFPLKLGNRSVVMARFEDDGGQAALAAFTPLAELPEAAAGLSGAVAQLRPGAKLEVDLFVGVKDTPPSQAELSAALATLAPDPRLLRVTLILSNAHGGEPWTYVQEGGVWREKAPIRGIHPSVADRLELGRLERFKVERLQTTLPDLYVFQGRALDNERDERLFVIAEVREMHPVRDASGRLVAAPEFEHVILAAFQAIREQQARREARKRLHWNRVTVFLRPTILARRDELLAMAERLAATTDGLGLEKVALRLNLHETEEQVPRDTVVSFSSPTGHSVDMSFSEPHAEPLRALDDYSLKLVRARQRRLTYAYEVVKMLTPAEPNGLPRGEFEELDLGGNGESHTLAPVRRPYGNNSANVVVGLVRSFTTKHPEGMTRLLIVGDGTREMGALGEPECARIIAALDMAETLGVPVDWFPVSSGAKIAMDSGTENLDWTAATLRRIIEFTQSGGAINVVVDGTNVGAQSYWNAEATMLMHTRGCLIMTPRGSMLLTGKRALDYSGGVSAEDNLGIGGFERIMGPNGQAQYFASDLSEACKILMRWHEHTFVAPGEKHPRRRPTTDASARDITLERYTGSEPFSVLGDVFTEAGNSGRHKPFDVRALMRSVADQDATPLERWAVQRDGETGVIWDTHLGGWPVCMIGIESKQVPRLGWAPADGPSNWSGGTLFPVSSKKVARAINGASGNRPVVVLANLSGFDGSPESMRLLQLEYGAEIGRAVVNFRGPLVFCVVARYHGGAYVVFSKRLNPSLVSLAVEGSFASVIGGSAAAAVVFPDEARSLANADPRIVEASARVKKGADTRVRREFQELLARVLAEKTLEVAKRFDAIHSVERALSVGSLDGIITAPQLRPALLAAVERGLGVGEKPAKPAARATKARAGKKTARDGR